MSQRSSPSLFGRSLRSLRDLWLDLVPPSWLPSDRTVRPDLPEGDVPVVRQQLEECLTARGGEVSARQRAAHLGQRYLELSTQGRHRFLQLLGEEFSVDRKALEQAITAYRSIEPPTEQARCRAESQMREALVSPLERLLTQFNDLPEGTHFLVDLRADLLEIENRSTHLQVLDGELQRLLRLWFDVGFLELRRLSWDSPASLLEKLIVYEAVHEIESWSDLRNRLDRDRRVYAFFHWRMPDEPLIFLEVALTRQLAGSIQGLLDEGATPLNPADATTAIFYSISGTQKGLRGISFGSFLIKRVVDALARDFPRIKTFATLSPMPGFCKWLAPRLEGGDASTPDALTEKELAGLQPVLAGRSLPELLASGAWHEDVELRDALEKPLLRLGAHYLVLARRGAAPLDPVARFHLGNGAHIERLNWRANTSAAGLAQSAGLMVNYGYEAGNIEANHEAFVDQGRVATSAAVRKLVG